MNKILNIFGFLFCLLILFSCETNRDENGDYLHGVITNPEGGNPGGGNTGNSRLLKKFTAVDSDGIVNIADYTYTGTKLTSVATSSTDDSSTKINITYTGDLVTKIVHINKDDTGQMVTSTLNMVHNGNVLTKINEEQDFGAGEVLKSNTTITYNGTKVLKIERTTFDNDTPPTLFSTITSDLTFSGENMSKWIYTVAFAPKGPVTLPPLVVTANFSNYDTNKNPFFGFPKELNIANTFLDSGGVSVLGFSPNNPKTVKVDGQSANYVYLYNSAGYPVSAITDFGKFTYEYY